MNVEERIQEAIVEATNELCESLALRISTIISEGVSELLYSSQLRKLDGLKKTGRNGLPREMSAREFRDYVSAGHFPKPDVDRGKHSRWLMETYDRWLDDPKRVPVDDFFASRKRKATK